MSQALITALIFGVVTALLASWYPQASSGPHWFDAGWYSFGGVIFGWWIRSGK